MKWKNQNDFKIATFNVRGLIKASKQCELISDLSKFGVHICAIQETHVTEEHLKIVIDRDTGDAYNLYFGKTSNRYHGVGFAVKKDIDCSVEQVDDRIIVANLKLDNRKLRIVNFYAPTTQRTKENPNETERLYNILESELNRTNRSNTFLVGDFNGIIGSGNSTYPKNIGPFGKGKSNLNGQFVIDLLVRNNLYACNTFFKHKLAHISTFVSNLTTPQRRNPFRNQIDFVFAHKNWKILNTDARSYINTRTSSDHRIVVSCFNVVWRKLFYKPAGIKYVTVDHLKNPEILEKYRISVSEKFEKFDSSSNQKLWKSICDACIDSSENLKPKTKRLQFSDPEIQILSEHQQNLKIRIDSTKDKNKKTLLKKARNKALNSIHKITKRKENQKVVDQILEIENSKNDSRRMFNAIKIIQRKSNNEIIVEDENNRKVLNDTQKIEIITEHFSKIFENNNVPEIENFQPAPLTEEFSANEIKSAILSLKNNKSPGIDQIRAEHLKCAPSEINQHIANLLNNVALTGEYPKELKIGLLTPLAKPGKIKGPPQNLRPVILLSLLRKILAICIIRRIDKRLKELAIPPSQAAYSTGRSTTELVFTFKILAEKAVTNDGYGIHFLLLDMSKAFDTIQRGTLLEDLKAFLEPDELHLIKLLLENVQLAVKIKNEIGKLFKTNIGSPQGDAASALFFILYLAVTLKIWREKFDKERVLTPSQINEKVFILDQQYADDCSYASTHTDVIDQIEKSLPPALKDRNLFINESKTERFSIINKDDTDWKKCKIVGSYLGTEEDFKRRKTLTNYTFATIKPIFRDHHLTKKTKLRIFSALIESVFLYNSEVWTVTKPLERAIDVFQRQILRTIFNIRWTSGNWLSNDALYEEFHQIPWSIKIERKRLLWFSHCARLDNDTPVFKALIHCLEPGSKYRGGQKTTLLSVIEKDLKKRGIDSIAQGVLEAQDRRAYALMVE